MQVHLDNCEACRSDFHLIHRALLEVRRESDLPKTAAMWEGVQSKIRQWKASQSNPELSAEAVRGRVADQVGLFLGSQATRKVLEPASPNNQNLLSLLEPVLAEFLGSGAAAALVNHVIDTAIVKI